MSWSSCVAERASWLARKRTASAILRGSASASGEIPGACGSVERLDARVDDQQRDLDAARAQLERGRVGDRSHAERSCRPQTAARQRAPRRAAGDLHQSRCPALRDRESSAGGQERERCAGRSRRPRVEAVEVGLGNRAAAEGPAALAAVRGGRVQHELDSTVSSGGLLQHAVHARGVRHVGLQRERAGRADAVQGAPRPRRPRHRPAVAHQQLDDRATQIARSEHDRTSLCLASRSSNRSIPSGWWFACHLVPLGRLLSRLLIGLTNSLTNQVSSSSPDPGDPRAARHRLEGQLEERPERPVELLSSASADIASRVRLNLNLAATRSSR